MSGDVVGQQAPLFFSPRPGDQLCFRIQFYAVGFLFPGFYPAGVSTSIQFLDTGLCLNAPIRAQLYGISRSADTFVNTRINI